jgi:Tol biopolymer transport system component
VTLASGTKLGPYEITGALGAGGMGEVYRAKDTRLDRIIAIKVLPDHLASRAELRERFDREARTVASLNHPHICTLHDIGHQDGIDYLVMEFLEGETLAERLKKGPLPLDQVLQYAIEIADALDKAHRKSITHRDLKPSNIMLTKSGTKLLDFGLAKLRQNAAPGSALSQLPTANEGITAQGTILGTLQYMAPEQLEAKTDQIDARTDIFAFGAVVYEMATGKKAFEGKSQASLIAAILEREPPAMSTLQPMAPPALDRVVKRCLAKDRDERWQSVNDLTHELKWIAEGGSQVTLAPTIAPKGIRALGRRPLILSLGSLVIGLTIAGLAVWNLKPAPASGSWPVTRAVINLPPGQQLASQQLAGLDIGHGPTLALSPDGTHLAYVASQGGIQQLYLRPMDGLEARPISGTEGGFNPFFSPDSQWLGFFAAGKLKKVSMSGGTPVTVCDAANYFGASWGPNDIIVFAASPSSGLLQVSAGGGTPKVFTEPDYERGETGYRWPDFLPGGKGLVFTALGGPNGENSAIVVQSLVTGRRARLPAATYARYVMSGYLVYARSGTLLAVPFDVSRLEVAGQPIPIAENVVQMTNGAAQFSISGPGSLVYVAGNVQEATSTLVWVDRKGEARPLMAPPRTYRWPRLSPDGRRVAVSIGNAGVAADIWLYDLARDALTRLTFGDRSDDPVWSPDGKWVAFLSWRAGPANLFWKRSDGSGGDERLTASEFEQVPYSWSPDGLALAFTEITSASGRDLWTLRLGDRQQRLLLQTPFEKTTPAFSPDGHWLAYVSNESGRLETYIQPYSGPSGKWQISTEGGTQPVWNRNGKELFYRSGDKMMAVDIATQPGVSVGKPRVLFERQYAPYTYDVSPDGQRFLMLKPAEETSPSAPTQINVVLNWFEELKGRVPTGK